MAQVIYNTGHAVSLELQYKECEALLTVVMTEVDHLKKRVSLDDILEEEGELSDNKKKAHYRRKERLNRLEDVQNALIELGNHLES